MRALTLSRLPAQDFGKLATFMPRRSVRDCIAFYYRTQKEDDWALVKRKLKLKKRRLQSEQNRTYLGFNGRMDPRDLGASGVSAVLQQSPALAEIQASMPLHGVREHAGGMQSVQQCARLGANNRMPARASRPDGPHSHGYMSAVWCTCTS